MDDAGKLVSIEATAAGTAEVIIDAQPSQFSDGYVIALTPSEALRLAHALIARVSDLPTKPLAVPMLAPTLEVAA
jgi:phosphopantothenate synthetase